MQANAKILENAEKLMSDISSQKNSMDLASRLTALTEHITIIMESKKVATPRSSHVINKLLKMSEGIQNVNKNVHVESVCRQKSADMDKTCDYSNAYENDDTNDNHEEWKIWTHTNIKYSDIKGCDDAISDISASVIIPLKFPIIFKRCNGRRSSGVLLYGPPGTGKSMIARATACEISATFYTASCAELTSRWVGGSEKKLKSLFQTASQHSPSIVFLDEIDSIAGIRGTDSTIADQRLTNQLLIELDIINNQQLDVFVIAATNLPWQIDDAVMRRLSRKIYIPMPCIAARTLMFEQAFSQNPSITPCNITEFAKASESLSGSDITTIINHINFKPLHTLYNCKNFEIVKTGTVLQSIAFFPVPDNTHTKATVKVHENTKTRPPTATSPSDESTTHEHDKSDSESVDVPEVPCTTYEMNTTFSDMVQRYGEDVFLIPQISVATILSEITTFTPTVSQKSKKQYTDYMNKQSK